MSIEIEIVHIKESILLELTIPNNYHILYTNIIAWTKNIHTEIVNDELLTENYIEGNTMYMNDYLNEDIIQNKYDE